MSYGNVATVGTGEIMASYIPVTSAGSPNFYIDRTDAGAVPVIAAGRFDKSYTVNFTGGCVAAGQANNCAGVSVIETNIGTNIKYAVTAAFSKGVIFTTLDNSGLTGGTGSALAFYPFPSGATAISKPLIVEAGTTNIYYITGSYSLSSTGTSMYVLRVNSSGAILHSRQYKIASYAELVPKDMIISPYLPGASAEVIVIGSAFFTITGGHKPYMLRLKQSDITVVSAIRYGQLSNPSQEWFNSISLANSSSPGGTGFVVTGHNDSLGVYPIWVEKLNQLGAPIWSSIFKPSYDFKNYLEGVDIVERNGSTGYQYFAATNSTLGMHVLKIDDSGNPFTSTVPILNNKNEFQFNFSGNQETAVALSYLDNGTSADIGIQVYGNHKATGDITFVEAPFNGVMGTGSGCASNQVTTITSRLAGPARSETVGILTSTGLAFCPNVSISDQTDSPTAITSCVSSGLPTGGSLLKSVATGVMENDGDSKEIRFFPNPTSGKVWLELNAVNENNLEIHLYDIFGRLIFKQNADIANRGDAQQFEINLEKYNLKNGIYYLHIFTGGKEYKEKIVFSKD